MDIAVSPKGDPLNQSVAVCAQNAERVLGPPTFPTR